jgi:hypothetical protein
VALRGVGATQRCPVKKPCADGCQIELTVQRMCSERHSGFICARPSLRDARDACLAPISESFSYFVVALYTMEIGTTDRRDRERIGIQYNNA